MEDKFDLITIGDSTIDTFIRVHDASVECDLNRRDCKICVPYGAKIPVDSIAYGVAGNAANVAVGCSMLGLRTAIYTNLGDDDQGERIKSALERANVSGDYINVNKDKASNLSVVLTFQGERTIFVYHQNWFYKLPKLDSCHFLYLTSMGESFTNSNIMDEICHYVDKTKAKLVFSPGTLQLKTDIKRFPKILERSEVLIVNLEEAKHILGISLAEIIDVRDLLSKLQLLGPKIAVITDGEHGSYATDGNRNLKVGVLPTKLVEKTGAGDAYASALIAAFVSGLPLEEAMVWGSVNASQVVSKIGAQNGLLTKDELTRLRKKVSQMQASTF